MSNLSSDAIPFDIPETESTKETEETKEKTEEKKTNKNDKKKKRSKYCDSDSDTESDSSDDFHLPKTVGTFISINKGKNIHLGNNYTQINTAISSVNLTSRTSEEKFEFKCTETEKSLSEDLLNSVREIDSDDMYKVAESISVLWKKLARYLPPKPAFTEAQLKTFEANNPNNLVEAIVDMFNDWKDRYPEDATVGNLAKALCEIKKSCIAETLEP